MEEAEKDLLVIEEKLLSAEKVNSELQFFLVLNFDDWFFAGEISLRADHGG